MMCKKIVYLFLVFGFCLTAARADLTMVPLTSWEITGDFGDVLSLNGYPVGRLIVGASEYASPPGQSGNEPAEAADDFTLETSACADGQDWMLTVFSEPVSMIFILEKNGNDSGTIQGLDAAGNPVGNALSFTGGSLYWTSTGYLASLLSTQQIAFGAVLTSDIPIYGIVITAPGIDPASIMAVGRDVSSSSMPEPADGATDVPRNAVTSWMPGDYAQTHDVYFGMTFEDVNNADRGNPLNVLANRDQIANTYDPGRLDFGQTYYWRIDDINATDSKVYKGYVWSFEVEPFAYPIPAGKITPTASGSQDADSGPEKTIDGSGLTDDLHSVELETMWLSNAGAPGSAWIQYDFDKPYKLHQMLAWNFNGPSFLTGYGLKDVAVEYSQDGQTWTVLPNVSEFAQASGVDGYACNTIVDFGGAVATSVKITANTNWGGAIFDQYGLGEVRFLYTPIRARYPSPDPGATDVAVDATLSWRAGREAASHDVYLSTDEHAVTDASVPADTVTGTSHRPLSLDLAQSYYWKVNEVNIVET
ncbi:MAG: discoidin domain-containing protein, partial [Phycisphaerales bacterium]